MADDDPVPEQPPQPPLPIFTPNFVDRIKQEPERPELDPLLVHDIVSASSAAAHNTLWDILKLDGDQEVLYRGFSVPESLPPLPSTSSPEDKSVAEGALLLFLAARTPSSDQIAHLAHELGARSPKMPDFVFGCVNAPSGASQPMTPLLSSIVALQSETEAHVSSDLTSRKSEDGATQLPPFVAAFIYRRFYKEGHAVFYDPALNLASSFRQMLGCDNLKAHDMMRMYLVTHSNQEVGTVSSHAVRLVGSTFADPYLALAAVMNGATSPVHSPTIQEPFKWLNKISLEVSGLNIAKGCLEDSAQTPEDAGQIVMSGYEDGALIKAYPRPIQMDLKVGDDFPTIDDLKEKVRTDCLEKHVEFYVVKSSRSKYTVRCRNPGCGWRMHASIIGTGPTCRIRSLSDHTCEGAPGLGNKNASAQWIAHKLQEKIKQHPNYRPVDIVRDLEREEGIQIPYARAWRGKEVAMISIHGDELKAYSMLPGYLSAIRAVNPGSIAFMECTGVVFHRLFLAYSACLRGFKYCRPFLAFDVVSLTGKYQGCLLTAMGLDAKDEPYPLSFAVVDSENEENWTWFMSTLKQSLQMEPSILSIISPREKGLLEAASAVFPDSNHAFCMRHLIENLKKEYTSNAEFIKLIWSAAHQVTPERFEEAMTAARALCSEGVQYMMNIGPIHWATAHFQGRRWGHLTSTVTELINSWLQEARQMPIVAMLESIRKLLAEWFFQRRQEAEVACQDPQYDPSALVQPIDKKLREAIILCQHYLVRPSDLTVFEIDTGKQTRIVNLDTCDCTCKEWQINGIPCAHACAAIIFRGDQCHMYADRCFSLEAYKESYDAAIYPVDMESIAMENVLPPETRRPPGRPRKRRSMLEFDENSRPFTCSRCGMQQRHNRRTCKNPVKYIEDGMYMTEGSNDGAVILSGDVAIHGSTYDNSLSRSRGRGRGRGFAIHNASA